MLFLRLISRPGNSHGLAFNFFLFSLLTLRAKLFRNSESWLLMGFVSVTAKFDKLVIRSLKVSTSKFLKLRINCRSNFFLGGLFVGAITKIGK